MIQTHIMSNIFDEGIDGWLKIDSRHISLDDFLDFELKNQKIRRILTHLFFAYFRHKKAIDGFLTENCRKVPTPELKAFLSLALTHANFQDKIAPEAGMNAAVDYAKLRFGEYPAKFANAILRKAFRNPVLQKVAFPENIEKRWRRSFGAEALAKLEKCFLEGGALCFRCRKGFDLTPEMCQELGAVKAVGENRIFNCYASTLPNAVINSEYLKDGRIYIQDSAAQEPIALVEPDTPVKNMLDLCGAPGGKALMLLEHLQNLPEKIVILDKSAKRQELTRENFLLRSIDAEIKVGDAAEFASETAFDLIVADVPCSNSGVFRQRPDAVWRFSVRELEKLVKIQKSILKNAVNLLAGNGLLLYSTCSLEAEEDQLQIKNFLHEHPQFSLLEEKFVLPSVMNDGSYSALLKKN